MDPSIPVQQPVSEVDERTTKVKIFDAAVDLFSTLGFSGVSIRDITRAVGIKESSFYNHYRGKDALIEAIYATFTDEFIRVMPPEDRLEKILADVGGEAFLMQGNRAFLERMANPRLQKIWRILFMEQYRDPRARALILQELIQRPLAYTETVFRKMSEMGLIRSLEPRLLAREYLYPVAFLSSYLMLETEGQAVEMAEAQLADHVRFFWQFLKKVE